MNNKAKHLERRSKIKLAIFTCLSILMLIIFIFGLIRNSNIAVEKYDRLIAVDQAGGDVESALNDLRSHIYTHMNTEIGGPNGIYPPIQLSGTYERLVAEEQARVEAANDELYTEAQNFCEATGSQGFSGGNRLACINSYIDENGQKIQPIDDSLYKYDFVSPRWSSDLAGISLIFFIVFTIFTAYYLFSYLKTRHMVHMAN